MAVHEDRVGTVAVEPEDLIVWAAVWGGPGAAWWSSEWTLAIVNRPDLTGERGVYCPKLVAGC